MKKDREKQILYVRTYIWNLKNNTNQFVYKTESQKTNSYQKGGKLKGCDSQL